jgi:hypothetical protein
MRLFEPVLVTVFEREIPILLVTRSMLLKRVASDRARSGDLGAAGNADGIGEGRRG